MFPDNCAFISGAHVSAFFVVVSVTFRLAHATLPEAGTAERSSVATVADEDAIQPNCVSNDPRAPTARDG
jgi:hypothetical protein